MSHEINPFADHTYKIRNIDKIKQRKESKVTLVIWPVIRVHFDLALDPGLDPDYRACSNSGS